MVLMGLGMGLISTPATESILLVLPPARAGVGSAPSTTRPASSAAPSGSPWSARSSPRSSARTSPSGAFAALPGDVLGRAQDSVGVAQAVAARDPRLVDGVPRLVHGRRCRTACVVVGLLCLAGAVAAAFLLPGRLPAPVEEDVVESESVAA